MTHDLNTAIHLWQSGRLAEAEQICGEALRAHPDQTAWLNLAGLIALSLGRHPDAESIFAHLVAQDPQQPVFHLNLATSRTAQADRPGAIAGLRRLIAWLPDNAEGWRRLGDVLVETGKDGLPEAVEAFRCLVALTPDDPLAYGLLGGALKRSGHLDEAVVRYRHTLALKPDFPEVAYNLGNALYELGRLDEAEACYRRVIDDRPDLSDAYLKLAGLLLDQGREDQSLAVHDQGATHTPHRAHLEALARSDRWDRVFTHIRRHAQDDPTLKTLLGDGVAAGSGATADAGRDAAFRRHLDAVLTAAPEPVPPFLARRRSGDPRPPIGRDGWRPSVLIAMNAFVRGDRTALPEELRLYTAEAARTLNLPVGLFDTDGMTYPGAEAPPPERRRALAAHIAATRPDIVLFDANYIGRDDDDGLNRPFVAALKRQFGFRAVFLLPDAWGGDGVARVRYWHPVADLIVYFEPGFPAPDHGPEAGRFLLVPIPVSSIFDDDGQERTRDLESCFVGTLYCDRVYWLSLLKHFCPGIHLVIGNRTSQSPDHAAFAAILRRSRIAFSFGHRGQGLHIVTGRTFEAMRSGCLLFEQEGSRLDAFFIPYRHYIPFRDGDDLLWKLDFFQRHEEYRQRIATAGRRHLTRHYAPENFWIGILERLHP